MERGFLSQKGSEVGRGLKEKQVSMADKSVKVHGIHSHGSANEENKNDDGNKVRPTLTGNNPSMSSYANVTRVPSRKALIFRTLFTPARNRVDVVVPIESIRAIRTLGGRSSYARALIKVRADVELKDHIMVAMPKLDEFPKNIDSDVVKKPSQATRGVLVGPKVWKLEGGGTIYSYEALLRPTPLPEYPTQDLTMSTSSLQAEKTVYTSLTLFSDTKLNVES
ncbi:hypothetical protein Tco_1101386 [Tanacetum coccineum]